MLGTRAALAPRLISRFLDLHVATKGGVWTFYLRDLDTSVDRAYGFGAGVDGFELGSIDLGISADSWDAVQTATGVEERRGWNAAAELDALVSRRWGFSAKLGGKATGFFPGLPLERGLYLGFGLLAAW
jgi:hypothetical protein